MKYIYYSQRTAIRSFFMYESVTVDSSFWESWGASPLPAMGASAHGVWADSLGPTPFSY